MAKMSEIKEGLEILLKYGEDGVAAEHEVLYAGGTPPESIDHEDRVRLEELGWRWDAGLDSWSRFT